MKKATLKILLFSYPTFLLLGFLLIIPIMFVLYGVSGVWESIKEDKDLSYTSFKKFREGVCDG